MHETLAWADLQDCGNAQAQLILLSIARNADWNTGICEVPQSTLCQMAKCSIRTCRNYLAKLEEDNLISRVERRNENGSKKCDRLILVGYQDWFSTIRKGGVVQAPLIIKSYQQAADLAASPEANLAAGQPLKDNDNLQNTSGKNQHASGKQAAAIKDSTILNYTTLNCTAETKIFGFQKYDLKHLGKVLFEAAGPCLDNEANCLGLLALTTPQMWLESGADLHLDILPTLQAYAVKYRGKKIRTWDYFTEAIARCKAARDAGLPQPSAEKSERSFRSSARNYKSKNELMEEALANLGKEEAKL